MTDTAVLAAISALSKKVDGIGGSEALDIPIAYTTIDKSEGPVTQAYIGSSGVQRNAASVRVGNDIYYFGGDDTSTVTTNCLKVDVTTGIPTAIAPYPNPNGISYAKAVEIPGNKILVVGGQTSATLGGSPQTNVYVYDITKKTWDTSVSYANPTYGGPYIDIYQYNGVVFIVGTRSPTSATSDYIYYKNFSIGHVPSSAWSTISSGSDIGGGASAQVGSKVYVFGGDAAATWELNLESLGIFAKAAGPNIWRDAKTIAIGSTVYVMQGESSGTFQPLLYAYDTVANTWTARTNIPASDTGSTVFTNSTTKFWLARVNGVLYEYDIAGNSWTTKTSNSLTIHPYLDGYMEGNEVMVPTSSVYGIISNYNVSTDTWRTSTIIPNVKGSATVAVGTKIYSFSGWTTSSTSPVNVSMVYDTTTKKWSQLTNIPTARWRATATHVNGKIYVIGGVQAGGSSSNKIEVYDVTNNSWVNGTNAPVSLGWPDAGVGQDGKIYATGGDRYVYIYDPTGNSWTTSLQNPVSRSAQASTLKNNKVYTVSSSSGYSIYDIASNTWISYNTVESPYPKAMFTYNNRVFMLNNNNNNILELDEVAGKWNPVTYTEFNSNGLDQYAESACLMGSRLYFVGPSGLYSMAYYDIGEGWWNSVTPDATNRYSPASAVYGNNLYIVGGSNTIANSGALNYVRMWSGKDNTWTNITTLASARLDMGAAVHGDYLYVFGGTSSAGAALNSVEQVHLKSGTVAAKANTPVNMSYCKAVTVGDYIYVHASTSLYRYNPNADTWMLVTNTAIQYAYTSPMVTDGQYIYWLGGNSVGALWTIRFDPEEWVFTSLADIPRSHYRGQGTYVSGKLIASGGDLQGTDIYDIETNTWTSLDAPVYPNRKLGTMEAVDGKIVLFGGSDTGGTILPNGLVESFVLPYDTVDPLEIEKTGIYYSMTNGITLRNETTGREGDGIAITPEHTVYAVGSAVDSGSATSIEVLKT